MTNLMEIKIRVGIDGRIEIETAIENIFINEAKLNLLGVRLKRSVKSYARCKKMGKGVELNGGDRCIMAKMK